AAHGRERLFWGLMFLGTLLWLAPQFWWIWYEVIQRAEMPNPSPGDIFLFIHVVPLMGALALRPHLKHSESKLNLDALDFALLMLWWVYLYTFIAMPWQFTEAASYAQFDRSWNILYLVENLFLVGLAGFLYKSARGFWKRIYGSIFIARLLYSLISFI